MKRFFSIIILSLLLLNINFSLLLAHHANEKYCFDCMHKYKIGDKKNNTYNFEVNLQNNDLSKKVGEQLKDKKTGLVSYILFENNKILVDQNRKSKYRGGYYPSHSVGKSLVSLVTGYAICDGYINSVFDNIDYPTVADTLYNDQKLLTYLTCKQVMNLLLVKDFTEKTTELTVKELTLIQHLLNLY